MIITVELDSANKFDGLAVLVMSKCYVEVTNFAKNKPTGKFLRFDIRTSETIKGAYSEDEPELLLSGDMSCENLNSSCISLDQIFYSTLLKDKVKEKLSQEASEKFLNWSKHNPFGEAKKQGPIRIFKQQTINNVFRCG